MKKSIQININSRIYNIDEDAYNLLNNYLKELRLAFGDGDGDEIVSDIEARISEIFAQRDNSIIVLADINEVIERMGRPEQLSDSYADSLQSAEPSKGAVPPPYPGTAQTPPPTHRKLYRSTTSRVFGGVLGGIATYFGWNAALLRILVTIFALCTAVWPFTIVYLIAWMVIPEARNARQRLEQLGATVTVSEVGTQVLGNSDAITTTDEPVDVMHIIGKCLLGFVGLIAAFVAIGTFIGLIACSTQSIALAYLPTHLPTSPYIIGALSCLAVMIPAVAISWFASSVLFKVRGAAPWLTIIAIIVEVIIIVVITILTTISNIDGYENIFIF